MRTASNSVGSDSTARPATPRTWAHGFVSKWTVPLLYAGVAVIALTTGCSPSTAATAPAEPQAAVSTASATLNTGTTTVEVFAKVQEVKTPPAKGRTVAIFVENRAGAAFNKDVPILEDQLASQLGSAQFVIISREDLMKAKKVYPTHAEFGTPRTIRNQTDYARAGAVGPGGIAEAETARSTTLVTVDKPEDQNLNPNRNSLGTTSDRLMSDGASAVRMAQLMGAEYVLIATIGSFGTSRATFDNPRLQLKGTTTKHVLRATYKVLDGYKGGSVAGGIAKAEKAVSGSDTVKIETDDTTNELIEDVSTQIVSALSEKIDALPRPVEPAKVTVTISSYAKDLAGNEISLPDIRLTEGKVSSNEQNFPALVSANVMIDGVNMGTTPVNLQILPGVHKLQLTRVGFETLDINFLAQEGTTLTPSMWMDQAGFKRWMEVRNFLNTLDTKRQLTAAQVKVMEGYAQMLRQSGYLVEIRKKTEEDIKVNTKEAPKTYLMKGLWDHWFSGW